MNLEFLRCLRRPKSSAIRITFVGMAVLVFASCDNGERLFSEGERIRVTVTERVNSWRSACVPLEVGTTFMLTIGEFDEHYECRSEEEENSLSCTQAPLVPLAPSFAENAVSSCNSGDYDDPLALYCSSEVSAGCGSSLALHLSPSIGRGQKVVEKGYLVVRWNLDVGADNDAGVFTPCLDGCEEGFRVKIEMLDR